MEKLVILKLGKDLFPARMVEVKSEEDNYKKD